MDGKRKPKKRILIGILCLFCILLLLAALAAGILFVYNRFTLSVIPYGDAEMVIDYGESYQEPGAVAHFSGSRFWIDGFVPEAEVTWEGTVDTSVTGDYTVTYSVDYRWWHAETQRKIHVVDRELPEITLEGEQELYILPGEQYVEAGYSAFDDYDGDLTSQVQIQESEGMITYWVCDAAGNRAEAVRLVHYDDPIAPEITLSDGNRVEVYAGTTFTEPGFTAWDNCDGDITDKVLTEGSIDLYRTGTYTITYTVTDSFDNTTVVERIVEVVPQPQPDQVTPEGKVIYLTFDDGPGPYTRELLEVLKKYNVKATFFVICNKYADVIGEIAEDGHAVGIHTACHEYKTIYASEEAYFADLLQVQDLIYEQTGERTSLLRFPGGSSNTVSRFNQGIMTRLAKAVQDAGYQYFDWNVDSNDAGGAKTADEVFENVTNGIRGRSYSIVLQHDIKGYSVDAVERIIIWGLNNGYVFLPLDPSSPTCHHGINN